MKDININENIANWYVSSFKSNFKNAIICSRNIDLNRNGISISFNVGDNYKIIFEVEQLGYFSLVVEDNKDDMVSIYINKEMKELQNIKYSVLLTIVDEKFINTMVSKFKNNLDSNNLIWSPKKLLNNYYLKYKKTIYRYDSYKEYLDGEQELLKKANY